MKSVAEMARGCAHGPLCRFVRKPDVLRARCERLLAWEHDFARRALIEYDRYMQLKLRTSDYAATILSPSIQAIRPLFRDCYSQSTLHQ